MTMIRLRDDNETLHVDVRAADCPTLCCFWLRRHTIRSAAGASGCSSRTTEDWECGRREQQGCPKEAARKPDLPSRYVRRGGIWRKRT